MQIKKEKSEYYKTILFLQCMFTSQPRSTFLSQLNDRNTKNLFHTSYKISNAHRKEEEQLEEPNILPYLFINHQYCFTSLEETNLSLSFFGTVWSHSLPFQSFHKPISITPTHAS